MQDTEIVQGIIDLLTFRLSIKVRYGNENIMKEGSARQ